MTFTINNDEPWMSIGLVTLNYPLQDFYIGENQYSKAFGIRSNGKTFYKMGFKINDLKGKQWTVGHKI